MPATARQTPRPYLSAEVRRTRLLDVAGGLVRRGGWTALSMQGLAVAAGVSRQLVYEHFGSVDELYLAALTHLFERAYAGAAAIGRSGRDLRETIRAALGQVLDLPREERQALRSLAGGVDDARPGLARARARLRDRIASIWVPVVQQQTGAEEAEAAALAWMFITASWALSDAVVEGTLPRQRALDVYVRFVEASLAAWAPSRPREPTRRALPRSGRRRGSRA